MRNVRTGAEAIVPRLRSHVTGVNVRRHALDSHISTGPHYWGQVTSVEPARLLTAVEIIPRVCEYFGCAPMEHLTQHVASTCTRHTGQLAVSSEHTVIILSHLRNLCDSMAIPRRINLEFTQMLPNLHRWDISCKLAFSKGSRQHHRQ